MFVCGASGDAVFIFRGSARCCWLLLACDTRPPHMHIFRSTPSQNPGGFGQAQSQPAFGASAPSPFGGGGFGQQQQQQQVR